MRKIQILVASVGAIGLIGAVGACSDNSSSSDTTTVSTNGNAMTTNGQASVTIDGKPLEMNSKTVVCNEAAGKVTIAIGDSTAGGTAGVGAVLTTGDNPQVQSVGLGATNGQALGWVRGVPGGDATATKDGKSYTISGNVTGIDMSNPTSPSKKSFEIKVTCP
ncbi:lipoprotein LpqH [Gordonia sp. TBRC 11910]|uniref:Lipoprotein LpqH n=1 Tax=Gordonia asplenii TaxID=2725283 RepID=A0A848KZL8_9ACTN|nr:lipoprotein LpqH [Gordonia asplenii]NMO04144.1 lipoprotein LpqH [Gordonia asplenii]